MDLKKTTGNKGRAQHCVTVPEINNIGDEKRDLQITDDERTIRFNRACKLLARMAIKAAAKEHYKKLQTATPLTCLPIQHKPLQPEGSPTTVSVSVPLSYNNASNPNEFVNVGLARNRDKACKVCETLTSVFYCLLWRYRKGSVSK